MTSNTSLKTTKGSLKTIMINDICYDKFMDVIHRSNDIIFICYHFMYAFILYCFKHKLPLPNTDSNFVRMSFKALLKKSVGPKPKGDNLKLYNMLSKFFSDEFVYALANKSKGSIKVDDLENYKLNGTNLSYIFNETEKEIETMIKNNITLNFCKYVNQYVNQHFLINNVKKLTKKQFNALSKDDQFKYLQKRNEQSEKNKIIMKEIANVKNDLFDNTKTADEKYKKWIKKHKQFIFPKLEHMSFSYEDDLDVNPYKYLPFMIIMNDQLEKNNFKTFRVFPLRTHITDKYITINTSALKDIFGEVNSGLTNEQIWNKYFNINTIKYKPKKYTFNFQISTDGYSVSVNFIEKSQILIKNKKSQARNNASKNTKNLLKGKNAEEQTTIRNQLEKDKQNKAIQNKQKLKKFKQEQKEKYNKLSIEEKEIEKQKIKKKEKKYEYFEDAIKDKNKKAHLLKQFMDKKIVTIDPGKRAPISALGYKIKNVPKTKRRKHKNKRNFTIGKIRKGMYFYSYNAQFRIRELKRLKYQKLIENKKNNLEMFNATLKKVEQKLSKHNTKTVNFEKFINFCKDKLQLRAELSIANNERKIKETKIMLKNNSQKMIKIVNGMIKSKKSDKLIEENLNYEFEILRLKEKIEYNKYLQKLKWFGYMNKQRHENKLLNDLEKVYGKEATFIFGDWSGKGKTKRISMPNMGMKKLLEKRFEIYLLDEYGTSKYCWKTKEEGKNKEVDMKWKKEGKEYVSKKKLHSILTFKMGEKREMIINRDYNANINMQEIVRSLLKEGDKPERFKRKVTTEKEVGIKVTGAKSVRIEVCKKGNKKIEPKRKNQTN